MRRFLNVGDAERVIRAGGVYINNRRIADSNSVMLPGEHILPNNLTLIRIGHFLSCCVYYAAL